MARKSIIEEKNLENEVKQMATQGLNCLAISKKLNINKEVVRQWCIKNDIVLTKRLKEGSLDKYKAFESICKKALKQNKKIKLNKTLEELGIHINVARKIFDKNPEYRQLVRDRKEAITQDKTLTLEKATAKLPEGEGSKVVSFEDGKYKVVTSDGYTYHKTSSKLFQGDPRNKCGRQHTVGAISSKLSQLGYKYLDGFSGNIKHPIKAVHEKCQKIRETRMESFFRQECPSCANTGTSKAELEILEWVQSYGFEAHSTRQIIKPKEIDIFIPSLNLGIEYCGLYWHSEEAGKGRNYHRDKMKACEEAGIRLITIFEDEWGKRNAQVKNFLKSIMGIHSKRIYARKCDIIQLDKKIARDFLEQHHIQGAALFKVAFGLYHDGELLGVVTGNKHHRNFEGTNDFILNRLVFSDEVQVVGGASKLTLQLVKYAKDNGFDKLVSWSDNRYSQGNVYEKCGFKLENVVPPDYNYVTPEFERQSKQSNKKANLLKKGAVGDENSTENELALSLGYSRIWDCGKKRWTINL